MKFIHTNIISTNWKNLVAFYVETFNCKIVPPIRNQTGKWLEKGTGVKNATLEGAHLLLPGYGESGPTLEIYQYSEIITQDFTPPNRRGFGHIAFEVENVERTLEKLISNGGTSFGEIVKKEIIGVGEITFTYARDPEGNLIELQCWTNASAQQRI
ncbi:VOC family protein [Muricauda sp. JGD-17]|uniref:VOC family protein n=1 Tax=Flagellimonas ochracea TaxID=2696472 RepID=A0A964T908_9FLAO|nr:VOC family protein [Allomuricauda ochracea]NAY90452.1 VOC family protein [Allomuricauda ochracea]